MAHQEDHIRNRLKRLWNDRVTEEDQVEDHHDQAEEVEAAQLGARGQRRRANLRPAQHPPPPLAVDTHSGAARRTDGLAVLRQHLPSRGARF